MSLPSLNKVITYLLRRTKTEMLFKLSNVNSNFAQILGYLNPALNNSALKVSRKPVKLVKQTKTSTWPYLNEITAHFIPEIKSKGYNVRNRRLSIPSQVNKIPPQNGVGFPYYTTEICLHMQAEKLVENLSNRDHDGKEPFLLSKN